MEEFLRLVFYTTFYKALKDGKQKGEALKTGSRKNEVDNSRLSGYKRKTMKQQARFFKALADETRLQILWLLLGEEELCVCDIIRTLGITQSKASRHLRYLFNVGLVSDRRVGVWMNYRLAVPPGSDREQFIKLLGEMLASAPDAKALRDKLEEWLRAKAVVGQENSCVC